MEDSMRHKISVVVLMLCVMTGITGCMNREQSFTLREKDNKYAFMCPDILF